MSAWATNCWVAEVYIGFEISDCQAEDNSEQYEKASKSTHHPSQKSGFCLRWENPRTTFCIAFHTQTLLTPVSV
jgi:hypothetical protein